jgi:hemoglobin
MIDSEHSLYELLGGETGIRKLVDRFYDLVDTSPEAAQIRSLLPKSLERPREKLFMFLSGWSGGPQLYIEKYGHPRLRMRHMPFPIGRAERDEWLCCMDRALHESQLDEQLIEFLKGKFTEIANSMQNRVDIDP